VLQALGAMGRTLIEEAPPWSEYLEKSEVGSIDWSRSNSLVWEGRALSNGRVSKAQKNVALTTSFIKGHLQLPLTAKEKELEAELSAAREAMGWEAA
jgi:DNA sulfur modification protein DndB